MAWDSSPRISRVRYFEPPKAGLKPRNPEYDCYERLAEEIRAVRPTVWRL